MRVRGAHCRDGDAAQDVREKLEHGVRDTEPSAGPGEDWIVDPKQVPGCNMPGPSGVHTAPGAEATGRDQVASSVGGQGL